MPRTVKNHTLIQSLLVLLLCLPLLALATPRGVALVIGNAGYADRPLKNPVNDARDLADALKRSGFEVILKQNLTADQMKEAIADFGDRLARERSVGLFYFSGHGMQTSKGQNFLLPVGRKYQRERDVEFYAVEARSVLNQMESAGNPLNIVVLDACRDAPLPVEARSASSKGLARMDAPSGSIIAFATSPGRTASDNPAERNGLYTKHLITAINTPGLRLEDVFKRVGRNVERDSNRQQSPEEMMKLRDDTPFFFTPGAPQPVVTPTPASYRPTPAVAIPAVDPAEAAYWAEVKKSEDADDYAAYLAAYPNGRYAPLAKLKHDKLKPAVLEPEMVRIPGKDYAMGKYEVTQAQWRSVMGGDPPELKFKGCDDCPVERVSWDDTQVYLKKLNEMTGKQYRLPTEEEWKHACDGGRSQEYCGSNSLDAVAWHQGNSGKKTRPVGQKQANGYGLYDMTGNVWEWQQDCSWGDCSPKRPLRGGSWINDSEDARALILSSIRSDIYGFRVVVRSARTH